MWDPHTQPDLPTKSSRHTIDTPHNYYSFNHRGQTLESVEVSLKKCMKKDDVVDIENGVLFCHKEVQTGAAEMAQARSLQA